MVFCGVYEEENLVVHPMDDLDSSHYISIIKAKEEPIFYVTCCCDEDWIWEFEYTRSEYERIKYLIMDAICVCDTMDELMDTLTEDFESYDMIFDNDTEEYECECDGDCENCIQH
jgi:hypothetical protein